MANVKNNLIDKYWRNATTNVFNSLHPKRSQLSYKIQSYFYAIFGNDQFQNLRQFDKEVLITAKVRGDDISITTPQYIRLKYSYSLIRFFSPLRWLQLLLGIVYLGADTFIGLPINKNKITLTRLAVNTICAVPRFILSLLFSAANYLIGIAAMVAEATPNFIYKYPRTSLAIASLWLVYGLVCYISGGAALALLPGMKVLTGLIVGKTLAVGVLSITIPSSLPVVSAIAGTLGTVATMEITGIADRIETKTGAFSKLKDKIRSFLASNQIEQKVSAEPANSTDLSSTARILDHEDMKQEVRPRADSLPILSVPTGSLSQDNQASEDAKQFRVKHAEVKQLKPENFLIRVLEWLPSSILAKVKQNYVSKANIGETVSKQDSTIPNPKPSATIQG